MASITTLASRMKAGVPVEPRETLALDDLERSVLTRDALLHCHGGAVAE
jgi:hypothetical protein